MHWDFPGEDTAEVESLQSLEALINRTSVRLDVYIEGFDITNLVRRWVEEFVVQVGDLIVAKAKLQLASEQATTNEVTIGYELDWDIYDQALRHFMLEDLVKNYLVEHWRDGDVDVEISTREGRALLCTFKIPS